MDTTQLNQHASEPSDDYTPWFLICWFLIPGLVQGIIYYYLFISDQERIQHEGVLLALGLFVFICPLVIYLSVEKVNRLLPLVFGVALALLCATLAYFAYQGFALPESMMQGHMDSSWPYVSSITASFVIVTISIPFFRTATQRQFGLTHYPSLFEFAWQQFVVACFAVLSVLLVMGVLLLATNLLRAVGATFMEHIWEPEIMFPLAFGAGALGVGITRQQPHIIKASSQLFLGLLKVLQPLHLLLSVIFLGYVVSTGFQTLDSSRLVSSILMFTVALGITLCSAAVGYEVAQKKGLFSNLWKLMGLVTLLISLLSLWLVWDRLSNYGPTHLYLVVSILLFVGFIYAVGYCLSLLPKSDSVKTVGNTNIFGALLALAIAILVQLPVFNLVSYSVKSQLARIEASDAEVDVSTLRWMQQMAGKSGNVALDQLYAQNSAGVDLPARFELYRRFNTRFSDNNNINGSTAKERLAPLYDTGRFKILSSGTELSADQKNELEIYLTGDPMFNIECVNAKNECRVFVVTELEQGSVFSLVLIRIAFDALQISWIYKSANDGWVQEGPNNNYVESSFLNLSAESIDEVFKKLDQGELPITSVSVPAVSIGGELLNPWYGQVK